MNKKSQALHFKHNENDDGFFYTLDDMRKYIKEKRFNAYALDDLGDYGYWKNRHRHHAKPHAEELGLLSVHIESCIYSTFKCMIFENIELSHDESIEFANAVKKLEKIGEDILKCENYGTLKDLTHQMDELKTKISNTWRSKRN